MDDLELRLQQTLRRKQPPSGFKACVLARSRKRRRPSWTWIPIAAAAAVLIGLAGTQYDQYRQGQRAKQQLILALEITSAKLAIVERTLTHE